MSGVQSQPKQVKRNRKFAADMISVSERQQFSNTGRSSLSPQRGENSPKNSRFEPLNLISRNQLYANEAQLSVHGEGESFVARFRPFGCGSAPLGIPWFRLIF